MVGSDVQSFGSFLKLVLAVSAPNCVLSGTADSSSFKRWSRRDVSLGKPIDWD